MFIIQILYNCNCLQLVSINKVALEAAQAILCDCVTSFSSLSAL